MDRNRARKRLPSSAAPSTSGSLQRSLFRRSDQSAALSLAGKDFVLDVENTRQLQNLSMEIEKLGGRVVTAVNEDRPPVCVVSDHHHVDKLQKLKAEQITQQMSKCLPMLLRDAIQNRVRIRSCTAFLESLNNFKLKVRSQKKMMQAPTKQKSSSSSTLTLLHSPYLKLEDGRGAFAPLVKQFTPQSNARTLYLGKYMGKSLFHRNHHPDAPKKTERSPADKHKMPPAPKSGFCEICNKKYERDKEHFNSREHQLHVSQPGLYAGVDELCGSFLDCISVPNKETMKRARASPPSPHSVTG